MSRFPPTFQLSRSWPFCLFWWGRGSRAPDSRNKADLLIKNKDFSVPRTMRRVEGAEWSVKVSLFSPFSPFLPCSPLVTWPVSRDQLKIWNIEIRELIETLFPFPHPSPPYTQNFFLSFRGRVVWRERGGSWYAGICCSEGAGGGKEIGPRVLLFASFCFGLWVRFVGSVLVSRSLILHDHVLIFLALLVLTFLPGQFSLSLLLVLNIIGFIYLLN
jgi:hypothetical protein